MSQGWLPAARAFVCVSVGVCAVSIDWAGDDDCKQRACFHRGPTAHAHAAYLLALVRGTSARRRCAGNESKSGRMAGQAPAHCNARSEKDGLAKGSVATDALVAFSAEVRIEALMQQTAMCTALWGESAALGAQFGPQCTRGGVKWTRRRWQSIWRAKCKNTRSQTRQTWIDRLPWRTPCAE